MAFRITTKILLLTDSYIPAREQFERVRCTLLGLRLSIYSLPKKPFYWKSKLGPFYDFLLFPVFFCCFLLSKTAAYSLVLALDYTPLI